jgi:hypothetical protein
MEKRRRHRYSARITAKDIRRAMADNAFGGRVRERILNGGSLESALAAEPSRRRAKFYKWKEFEVDWLRASLIVYLIALS